MEKLPAAECGFVDGDNGKIPFNKVMNSHCEPTCTGGLKRVRRIIDQDLADKLCQFPPGCDFFYTAIYVFSYHDLLSTLSNSLTNATLVSNESVYDFTNTCDIVMI